jgi:hypothetical protein
MAPRKAHLPTGAFLDFRVPLSTAWTRSSKGTVAPTSGPGAPVRRRWSLFSHCTYADTVGTVRLTRPQPYIAWTIFTPTCISFPHRPAVVLPSMDISIRPACIRCQDLCDCARANSDLRTGKRAHSCNPRPAREKVSGQAPPWPRRSNSWVAWLFSSSSAKPSLLHPPFFRLQGSRARCAGDDGAVDAGCHRSVRIEVWARC